MRTIRLDNDTRLERPSVATIGFFDGVHRGHQFLLRQVAETAQACGMQSLAITFDRHPREVLRPDSPPELLTALDAKLLLLSHTGIDAAVVLPFDKQMAALSAQEFMERVLRRQLHVEKLVIGYDHHFGHNRNEGFAGYVEYGRQLGMEVVQSTPFAVDGLQVSSSKVRKFIAAGDIRQANACLGYPFTIQGSVEHGFAEGRKMGFPTANLRVAGSQLLPCSGVYAVWARPEGTMQMHRAMMNIGTRPTFGGRQQTLEVNLFNYQGNLYGRQLLVSFADRVRDERPFESAEQLARQLQEDKQTVIKILNKQYE